ncbi:MAG TPA: AraC family transcriptional regulator [Polyangiaceae bacterium]|nr:AraC family transcriptional regulator [Polyangiaceae bacterium]
MPSATFPAVHVLHGAELAKTWGIAPDVLLSELGLDAESLAIPGAQVPVETLVALVEKTRARTGEPAIGVFLGLQMRAPAHGYLGFAAMTSPTLRHALDVATRFAPTRTNAIRLSLHTNDEQASLILEERADFGPARDAILFALAIGLWQIGNALTGRDLPGSADFAFDRPAYADRFPQLVQSVRFGQPVNQLVFDARQLDLPLTSADPGSFRLAYEQCERTLEALDATGQLLERVRRLALRPEGGCRSLVEVSAAVHVSARTLKRRLAEQEVTYTDLLDGQRRERALLLLRSPALSLDDVAAKLGYSDTANFGRAFRRWTGVSPGSYRRGVLPSL